MLDKSEFSIYKIFIVVFVPFWMFEIFHVQNFKIKCELTYYLSYLITVPMALTSNWSS